MESLPPELLLAIARRLPQNDLPAFARTCSALALLARRVLYRHLTPSSASARTLSLVPLLARKPHIARHVRAFHLAVDHAAPVLAPFYAVLAAALRNMSRLRSLHLLLDPSASWVLRDAAPPHLLHFSSTFPLDGNVVRFLHLTPALRELELDSAPTIRPSPPLPTLPETSIPRLDQFIGSCRAAALIVPGRPVTSIHLNASTLREDDIPLLARSTARVLVLAATTNSSPVSFLQLLHCHLPHLAYLRVMSTHQFCQPPSPASYEQVASVLGSFAHLRDFELYGIRWCSQQKHDDISKRIWHCSPLLYMTTRDLFFSPDIFPAYDAV